MNRLYTLLQLTDSSFPSGAFAHSGGLEGFLAQAGSLPSSQLTEVLRSLWKQQLLPADGALGLAAHRAAARGDIEEVMACDRRLHALKLGRELREASTRVGHSFTSEARRLVSGGLMEAYASAIDSNRTPGNYSVAFMVVCAAIETDEETALLAWGFQTVTQMSAALLRLGVIGHRSATVLIAQLNEDVESEVQRLRTGESLAVSSFAPMLEIASMAHERQYSRLFQS